MKKLLVLLLVLFCFSVSPPKNSFAFASGLPTVDIANLMQAILQYKQLIIEYAKMAEIAGLNAKQAITMIEQLKQMLREYDFLLAQAQGLKNKFDNKQWARLWQQTRDLYRYTPLYGQDIQEASEETFKKGVQATRNLYGTLLSKQKMEKRVKEIYGRTPPPGVMKTFEKSYRRATMGMDQHKAVNILEKTTEIAKAVIKKNHNKVKNLGENSQLATLQVIAEQNQLILNQLSQLNQVTTKQLEYSNQFENDYYNAVQADYEEQLKRVAKAQKIDAYNRKR